MQMPRRPSDHDERPRLDASALPEEVQRLWETMLRLDPNWDMHAWLSERATEEMKIVEANLGREKMRLEQRISRIEALANRMGRERELAEEDPHQCNLFDVFGTDSPPTQEIVEEEEDWEPHPAAAHIGYISDDAGDDPLLAVCAQAILVHIEDCAVRDALPVDLEGLGAALIPRGIDSEELVEALEWLLEQGRLIEVAENEFILD
jgi:hypothetical protein